MPQERNKKLKWKLGWMPDIPDARDYIYEAPLQVKRSALPKAVDLRKKCSPVFNQGNLGSCTANALTAAVEFAKKKQRQKSFRLSRLFLYYNERVMMGTVESDSGAYLRDGIKSLNKDGVCPEKQWKYSDKIGPNAPFKQKPTTDCYESALEDRIEKYMRIDLNIQSIKECLAEGFPFVFGFAVYDSFLSASVTETGKMPMPNIRTERMRGGHAVMAVGYDDDKQVVIVRNSWGKSWGDKGYFYMPYEFIQSPKFCADLWTVRYVL